MDESVPFDAGQAYLHEAGPGSADGLVLTHGAGSNFKSALLLAVAEAFASAGVTVLRYNLPFRQNKPFGPPGRYDGVADRGGLRMAAAWLRDHLHGRLFLGGHSYGGRQASILASEEGSLADGLLLLSYPLHPPKKPEQLRTGHFTALAVPALFVVGDGDPFATVDELRNATALIPTRTKITVLENEGHDLARGQFDIPALLVTPLLELTAKTGSAVAAVD